MSLAPEVSNSALWALTLTASPIRYEEISQTCFTVDAVQYSPCKPQRSTTERSPFSIQSFVGSASGVQQGAEGCVYNLHELLSKSRKEGFE